MGSNDENDKMFVIMIIIMAMYFASLFYIITR